MPYNPGGQTGPPGPPGPTAVIQDEGVPLPGAPHTTLNFVGAGVTATDAGFGVAQISIPGGGAGPAIPLNEIVFGTGPSVTSDPDFTFDPTLGQFWVNTADGLTRSAFSPPGNVRIFAADGSAAADDGGDIRLLAGFALVSGDGGDARLHAGSSDVSGDGGDARLQGGHATLGNGGLVTVEAGATETGTGGFVEILSGSANTDGNGGDITIRSGSPAGAANRDAGEIFILGGDAIGFDDGGFIHIIAGFGTNDGGIIEIVGGNSDVDAGSIVIQSGSGTGVNSNGGAIDIVAGVSTGINPGAVLNISAGECIGSGDGGDLILEAGNGGSTAVSVPGDVEVRGGVAGFAGSVGGMVNVRGGGAINNTGGNVNIFGGDVAGTGTGGDVSLFGGDGGDTSGNAGSINLTGGAPTEGDGGSVIIVANDGVGTNRNGGIVQIHAGERTGTGIAGSIFLEFPTTGDLQLDSDPGAAGEVLTSQGAALPPVWSPSTAPTVFTSTDQTITSAGSLTLAHGLGAVPDLVQTFLINVTAQHGYAVGDIVAVGEYIGSAERGTSFVVDATNLNIRYSSSAAVFNVLNKTTGTSAAITPANWTARFRAVKF